MSSAEQRKCRKAVLTLLSNNENNNKDDKWPLRGAPKRVEKTRNAKKPQFIERHFYRMNIHHEIIKIIISV